MLIRKRISHGIDGMERWTISDGLLQIREPEFRMDVWSRNARPDLQDCATKASTEKIPAIVHNLSFYTFQSRSNFKIASLGFQSLNGGQ